MKKTILLGSMVLLLLLPLAMAQASLQISNIDYPTEVFQGDTLTVSTSVSATGLVGSTTVTVTLTPKDGLESENNVKTVVLTEASSQTVTWSVVAKELGICENDICGYEKPFTIKAEGENLMPTTETTTQFLRVRERVQWDVVFTATEPVGEGDTFSLDLSIRVSDVVEGVKIELDIPGNWADVIAGSKTYELASITGSETLSWILKAISPVTSNIVYVKITSTDPVKSITKSVTVPGVVAEAPVEGIVLPPVVELRNATRRLRLVPGVGIRDNLKLQAALARVLGIAQLSQEAIENLLRLSESISADIEIIRNFIAEVGKSTLEMRMRYGGVKRIKNFIVYDGIPKTFANSSDLITVSTEGASYGVVEKDPEYVFVFPELDPGEEVVISYSVDAEVDPSVINETFTEVYAEALEEVIPECPVCPEPSAWSKCVEGRQNRTAYRCGPETGYVCEAYTEERECVVPPVYWPWLIAAALIAVVVIAVLLWKGLIRLPRWLRLPGAKPWEDYFRKYRK